MEIGVPVALPSKTPERISTLSASFLEVTTSLCPGALLSSSFCMSSSFSYKPAVQPSTTTPIALPWLSPHVVSLNKVPNVFDILLQLHLDIMGNQITCFFRIKARSVNCVICRIFVALLSFLQYILNLLQVILFCQCRPFALLEPFSQGLYVCGQQDYQ